MTVGLFERNGYRRPDGIWVFSHAQFNLRFPYEPGDHVVFGGPSKRGKTSLAFDLIEPLASPDFPAYVAVSKPTDPVTEKRGKELGFRFVSDWPPTILVKEVINGKPPGYVIWPQFGDINTDFQNAARVTARLLADRYSASARKEKITAGMLIMDDTMVKAKIMGLDKQMTTIIAMAGAMKIGMWVFIQKPTDSGDTTLWAFENCDHLICTKGGDGRMLDRYAQIAGEHKKTVLRVVPTLEKYQFLYLNKAEGWICIVDKS